jgi:hypothetical protein
MALIVEQHVIADMYPVAAAAFVSGISAGMLVTLNAAGEAIQATTSLMDSVIGIAGDSILTTAGQTTAYSAEVVVGAQDSDTARTRWTSNRVSDMYDEAAASGKITVYNGGGKFQISADLLSPVANTIVPGDGLIATDGGLWDEVTDNAAGDQVALCVGVPSAYPSGVPGTDTADGSIELANGSVGNLWVPISLRI